MAEPDDDGVTFTDEEYAEFFAEPEDRAPRRRRIPRWARLIGAIAALSMLAGTITVLVDEIGNLATIREPVEIRDHARQRIAESEWGWLATDVVVVAIEEPHIGARVTNNPPDGIITIDRRPWNPDRLDRLIDHELGHLLDFAIWRDAARDERRGGLASEPWAECAAVVAGTRRVDRTGVDDDYHCYEDELDIYRAEIAALAEVCRPWATPECRPVATLPS